MNRPVIVLGGGGHARVLLDMLRRLKREVAGVVDPGLPVGGLWRGVPVLGDDTAIFCHVPQGVELVNGIGSLPRDNGLRRRLFEHFTLQGYCFATLVDPQAWVAEDVELAVGVQIMAGVNIQTGTRIACNSIVNSGATIDHDCRIGCHVHVAPGAVLSGGVTLGDGVHVGTGACLIQSVAVGEGSVIGAGAVVTGNVVARRIVYPPRAVVRNLT